MEYSTDTWHGHVGGAAGNQRVSPAPESIPEDAVVGSWDTSLLRRHAQKKATGRHFSGGSGGTTTGPSPFDPERGTSRISPNRRRWTHIFPKARSGDYVQPFQFGRGGSGSGVGGDASSQLHRPMTAHEWTAESTVAGVAGRSGVDWRSLTTPALLPITTDFFPGTK